MERFGKEGNGADSGCLQHFFERHPGDSLTPISRLTCGGIAGITSVTFTYPLDIVRTRLSIQSASFAELGEKPKKLPGMWQTMISMYRTEGGIAALYRGIVPTVAGVAPYVCGPEKGGSGAGLTLCATGRLEFHDVRVCQAVSDVRRRPKSQRCPEAGRRRHLRRCGADMHIPIVSFSEIAARQTKPDADRIFQ